MLSWHEFVIFTAEWDDAEIEIGSSKTADHVAMKSGAVDDMSPRELAGRGFDNRIVSTHGNAYDARSEFQFASRGDDEFRILCGDHRIVRNAGAGNVQAANAAGVGLKFAYLVRADQTKPGDAIGNSPGMEFVERGQFIFVGGDDDFPADVDGQRVLAAESDHFGSTCDAHLCLVGAGLIVQAGVYDSAVAPGLMRGDARFFFEHDQADSGMTARKFERRSESDDSCTDDDYVVSGSHYRHLRPRNERAQHQALVYPVACGGSSPIEIHNTGGREKRATSHIHSHGAEPPGDAQ